MTARRLKEDAATHVNHPDFVSLEIRPLVLLAVLKQPPCRTEILYKAVESRLRGLYGQVPEGKLVSLMPWLGWAEISQADAMKKEKLSDGSIPSAVTLRQMRDQVWEHQLTILDAGQDGPDMVGGIVFTSAFRHGAPTATLFPTWQSTRPLAFIATMLGDTRLTEPAERPREIARLMASLRFLRQLQVDEKSAWMYPNPELAMGGIRAAVWDSSLPIDATSMTLLTVVEAIKSLEKIQQEMAGPQQP